jgi:hypothetical protein
MANVNGAVRIWQRRSNRISFWVLHSNQIGRKSTKVFSFLGVACGPRFRLHAVPGSIANAGASSQRIPLNTVRDRHC